jgi:hypothetical protein
MRTRTACTQCRRAKRRCVRTSGEICAPCQQRQLLCEGKLQVYFGGQRNLVPRSSDIGGNSIQSSQHRECQTGPGLILSNGTAIELVEHYLDKFHGRPHSIFHPATLRSMVCNSSLNRALLYSICAIGCNFSGNPDIRSQGPGLAAESKRLLQADISNVCLENIQACILVAMLSVGQGNCASEALFFRTYVLNGRECSSNQLADHSHF